MAKLYGYPPNSVGGRAILHGRAEYDAGKPTPRHWPYLATRGWWDRKKETEKESSE